MIQPVELADFMATFFASAGVILGGAGYALLYAWARLKQQSGFWYGAFGFFALLAFCILILIKTAHLEGHWWLLAITMLLGYLVAPPAIFRLCQGTHATDHTESSPPT